MEKISKLQIKIGKGSSWKTVAIVVLVVLNIVFYKTDAIEVVLGQDLVEIDFAPQERLIENVKVIKVIDGDTIEIEGGLKVRYIGIDAPEMNYYEDRSPECMSAEATAFNKDLVLGEVVTLETDEQLNDKYGRLLAYVYVGSEMINEKMVTGGMAEAKYYHPNDRYRDELEQAEEMAIAKKIGLWSVCK